MKHLTLFGIVLCFLLFSITGCAKKEPELYYEEVTKSGETYLAVQRCMPEQLEPDISVPETWNGLDVRVIQSNAFSTGVYANVDIGAVQEIEDRGFERCLMLINIDLRSVKVIGAEAFSGCNYLESITIPASTKTIEEYAFHNCISLKDAYFLGNPDNLGAHIFEKGVTIHGVPGGSVEAYAKEEGLLFCPLSNTE